MQASRSELRRLRDLQHQAKLIRRQKIRVLNPINPGDRIPLEAAVRHVSRSAAKWATVGGEQCIEFYGHVRQSAEANAAADRAVRTGTATPAMIAALPCVRPGDLLAPSPRRHFGSANSVRKIGQGRTEGERAFCEAMRRAGFTVVSG